MKATVQEPAPCRRAIQIEVPAEEVRAEIDRTSRRFAKGVALPGFRKGQAPPALVRKRYQREIEGEAIEHLTHDLTWKVIEEHKIHPLHQPVVEEARYREGEPLSFRATFEIRPSFTLGVYRGLAAERRLPPVTDGEVERHVAEVRERRARLDAIEGRPLALGDVGVLDLQRLDAASLPDGEPRLGVHVEVTETGAPSELRAALLGASVGEDREVTLTPAEGAPGPEGVAPAPDRYRVTLRALRLKVLPALDDELAKEIGLDNLGQLREQIRADLERRVAERAAEEVRESILRQIVEAHPFPLPDLLVRQEQTHLLEMMVASLARQGVDPNKLDWDWDARRTEMREPAERRVRVDLLLDAVAVQEGFEVPEAEVVVALRQEAERSHTALPVLRARLEREGRLEVLKLKMLRAKSLDLIVRSANITDNLSTQAGERA